MKHSLIQYVVFAMLPLVVFLVACAPVRKDIIVGPRESSESTSPKNLDSISASETTDADKSLSQERKGKTFLSNETNVRGSVAVGTCTHAETHIGNGAYNITEKYYYSEGYVGECSKLDGAGMAMHLNPWKCSSDDLLGELIEHKIYGVYRLPIYTCISNVFP